MAALPTDAEHYSMKWDGEWHITYEVFRDLGIAFAAVLILIYALVVGWFQSFITPLVIMAAIPFSLVGILPAHGLLHAFFTATSMIGFIAGAGIVVRNSIILVDFIELRLREGMPLDAGGDRRRRGPLPADAADRGGGSGGRGRDPVRPDFPGPGHRADGRGNRVAGAVAHDGADCLFRRESKEKNCMSVERYLRLIAGFFVMLSVALGYWVSPAWFLFTAFVGLEPVPVGVHRLVPDDDVSAEIGRGIVAEGRGSVTVGNEHVRLLGITAGCRVFHRAEVGAAPLWRAYLNGECLPRRVSTHGEERAGKPGRDEGEGRRVKLRRHPRHDAVGRGRPARSLPGSRCAEAS